MRMAKLAVPVLIALAIIGAACGKEEAEIDGLSPLAPEGVVPVNEEPIEEPGDVTSGQAIGGMMIPRPLDVDALVQQSRVLVLGNIGSVLGERTIAYYGEDGKPAEDGEEGGTPYTDYEVLIESVLKGDGAVEGGGTLVLRMFGQMSQQTQALTSVAVRLPESGSHYLFALGHNPDGTYGSGSEGLISVNGQYVEYIDGVRFASSTTPEQFLQDIKDAASRPPCCKKVAGG